MKLSILFNTFIDKIREKRTKAENFVLVLCLLMIVFCILLLLPQIKYLIISLTEDYLIGRALQDHKLWYNYISGLSIIGIIIAASLLFIKCNADCKKIAIEMKNEMMNEIKKITTKNMLFRFLCMFGIYIFGISGIIRADFKYIDDLGRTVDGYMKWSSFSRYIADFLAIIIHADIKLNDISPLPQIIAVVFAAIASVLLVYIISGRVTKTACFVSLPVGLSPYFLECFSYKFDAPYIAFSVLVSIVPFLFEKNKKNFFVCSIVMLMIMCMTYQASSGIYIIIAIFLCFKAWSEKTKTRREIAVFAAVSLISYCIALGFFRLFFMKIVDLSYVANDAFSIHEIIPGALNNLKSFMLTVNGDFGIIWKVLTISLCLTFIAAAAAFSKRNRIITLVLSLAAIILMFVMSFGVYPLLKRPLFAPRAMYGAGIFIAVIGIYLSGLQHRKFMIPAILLCWCFFVFAFTYGNALSEQKRYNNFRTEIILNDLSALFPERSGNPIPVKLKNSIDMAPSIQNIAARNPVINRLIPVNLVEGWPWGIFYLERYYNFNLQSDEGIEEAGMKELLDSYYHTIKSDGKNVLIILK